MPTLDEVRRHFGGDKVSSMEPTVEDNRRRSSERMLDKIRGKRGRDRPISNYVINVDGDDALLKFGKHSGKYLTEVARMEPSYLDWLVKNVYPEDLKDVARYIMRLERIPRRS
jgi:hypothetical protein